MRRKATREQEVIFTTTQREAIFNNAVQEILQRNPNLST